MVSAQLERCDESRYVKAELGVHAFDVAELVGVRKVLAIPREKKIALVVRRHRKVERVPNRISRHDVLQDIDLDDLGDSRLERQNG